MAGSQRMTMTWCHHSYPTPIRTLGGTLLGFCPWPPYLIFVCGHWARVHGHWPNHHGEVSKQGGRGPHSSTPQQGHTRAHLSQSIRASCCSSSPKQWQRQENPLIPLSLWSHHAPLNLQIFLFLLHSSPMQLLPVISPGNLLRPLSPFPPCMGTRSGES